MTNLVSPAAEEPSFLVMPHPLSRKAHIPRYSTVEGNVNGEVCPSAFVVSNAKSPMYCKMLPLEKTRFSIFLQPLNAR